MKKLSKKRNFEIFLLNAFDFWILDPLQIQENELFVFWFE